MRIPAALCGIYGIRVTRGRFDMSGAVPMAPSFDAGGWFSAGPGQLRRAGDVLLEPARAASAITRLNVLDDAFDWFRLVDGDYLLVEPDARGVIESREFPGLRLNVLRLLAGDLATVLAELA